MVMPLNFPRDNPGRLRSAQKNRMGHAPPRTHSLGRATALGPALGLSLFAVLLLAGCQSDQIESYTVPRVQMPQTRLIAAIFPQPEKVWFFKLEGPAEHVAEHKAKFDDFLQTVRFVGKGEPPEFKAPD